jgi:hypothetical protein
MNEIIEGIKNNRPVFIKNFLLDYNVYKESLVKILKDTSTASKHNYTNGVYSKNLDNFNFISRIKGELNQEYDLQYKEKTRYWIHPKGNITTPHYDGDGTNVINICIQGKKKFILSPPNSQINYSFTNISALDIAQSKNIYILEENDLLLIPSFWYHEVHCLEKDTITINITFTKKDMEVPDKQKVIYMLHKYLDTTMGINSNIVNISTNKDISTSSFTFEYVIELISIVIFYLILNFIGKKYNIYLNEMVLTFFILFSIYNYTQMSGIPFITTFNYLMVYIIFTLFMSNN